MNNRWKKGACAFALSALLMANLPSQALGAEEYRLRTGQVITIGVYGYEDLRQQEVPIRPDGRISVPLVGEVHAAGLTVSELTEQITARMSRFINEPQITVNLLKPHTTKIYILGEVPRPGLYNLEGSHNLLDAIGMAGGYTKDAAKRNVFVVRAGQTKGDPIKVDLLALLRKGETKNNIQLGEGDTVFISANNRIDIGRDILPIITGAYYITHFGE